MSPLRVTPVLLALAACASPVSRSDAPDASSVIDAGTTIDAGDPVDAGPPSNYSACSYIGGLDRIGIWRRDDVTGACAYLRLVQPGGTWDYLPDLDLPANWGVEGAKLGRPDHCDCEALGWFEGDDAIDGTGFVTFDVADGGYWPRSLSIDVTLTFDGGTDVHFQTDALPLEP